MNGPRRLCRSPVGYVDAFIRDQLGADVEYGGAVRAWGTKIHMSDDIIARVTARRPDYGLPGWRRRRCGGAARLESGYDRGYTRAMKTAVSLPDPLFEAADRLARQLGKSRSQLYAEALQAFLERHRDDDITARLNEIYDAEPELAKLDPVLDALQLEVLRREKW
ncbi:MAG: ribbon-helix-helix domain-containing protein [Geminicoccaceae bacterium]